MTEQRAHTNQERRTVSYSHDKDSNSGINTHHGCKCHTKYGEEMEISSTAENETALGEFQREIKRTVLAMLSYINGKAYFTFCTVTCNLNSLREISQILMDEELFSLL